MYIKETVSQFINFLMENPEAQAKAQELGTDMDALATYAREQGFDVSAEELGAYQAGARDMQKAHAQAKMQKADTFRDLSPGTQAFHALIKRGEEDDVVAARLAELATAPPEDLIAYGRELGYDFKEQDMQTFGQAILESSDELTDEELELAAGGTTVLLFVGILAFGAFALGTAGVAVAVAFVVSKKKG